jgi:hypothetical protein
MYKVKYLLIFIITILMSLSAYSQDAFDDIIEEIIPKTKLSNVQLTHLKQELRIQKMLIEGVKEIELSGGVFKDINKSTNTLHDLLKSTIGAKSKGIVQEVGDQTLDTVKKGINKKAIKDILIKTRDYAYSFGNNKKIFMTSIARRFGFDVGLVYLTSLQVDLTFPMIMMASGQPQFGVLLAIPVSSAATGTYAAIKSAVKFRQVIKAFGGIKETINHFKIFNKMKSFFSRSILLKQDLIDINLFGKTVVFTVEKQNIISKTLSKMGWNKNLNFDNLVRVMEENNIMPSVLEKIKNSDRPSQVKLIRILNKIESTRNPEVLSILKNKFGKFINEIDGLQDFTKHRKWAIDLAQSDTFERFIEKLALMPDDFPPKAFDKIWRNYILIESSKNITPYMSKTNLKAFDNLFNKYTKEFRGDINNNIDYKFSSDLKRKFSDYIFNSLEGVGICSQLFRKKHSGIQPFL